MQEIELKFLDIDVHAIAAILDAAKAPKKEGDVRSMYFSHDLLGFSFQSSNKKTLRLRTMHGSTRLTYKGPDTGKHFKEREELQVDVSDFDETVRILKAIGFSASKEIPSHRTNYDFDGCSVEVDEYPGMKPYIEIEGPSEDAIKEVCKKLSLDFACGTNISISQLYPQFFVPEN